VGWTKVALQPNEARTVSIAIPSQRFAVWNADAHAWRVGAGSYTLSAAASSRDPHALSQTVTLAAR
ncbi:beta-glucosidase, partial [Burkholderia sp. TJI49]